MEKMDRASKRFGSKKPTDAKAEPGDEKKAESTASGKEAPHATPRAESKTVEMEPNKTGATAKGADPHSEMTTRHGAEMEAMHKRHQQQMADMHKMQADEAKQMHSRHAGEIGTVGNNGAGATEEKGPSLPSAKKAAGKGWKTRDKGKGGTEPKGAK